MKEEKENKEDEELDEIEEEGIILKSEHQGLTVCISSHKHSAKELIGWAVNTLGWMKDYVLDGNVTKRPMVGVS